MLLTFLKGMSSRLVVSLLSIFTTHTTREFERFTTVALPGVPPKGSDRAAPAPSLTNVRPLRVEAEPIADPAGCEELFTRLIRGGHFDSAWELLTPDSQKSWGDRDSFRAEMETRQPGRGLLGSRVREVRLLPFWTDNETRRTYREVAELVVDYSIQHQSRELVVTRDVHLVNVSGGWKSLCYRT